jgi:hypothetical protein
MVIAEEWQAFVPRSKIVEARRNYSLRLDWRKSQIDHTSFHFEFVVPRFA